MRRYALMILVIALLLANAALKNAAEANPLTNLPLWELRFALPAGVVAAALCFVALGLGAQFWRGLLPLCGGGAWAPQGLWARVAAAGLWCGWLPLLCAQTYTAGETQLALGAPSHWLLGAFGALLACRVADVLLHRWRWWGLISALVAAGAAVLCGQELFPALPLCPLVLGLMAAVALHVLIGSGGALQPVWLLVACFTFCAYVAAFGYLLAWYVPTELPSGATWGLWMGGVFLAGGLALLMLEPLRRSALGPRLIALIGLLAGAAWVWPELAAAQRILPAQQAAGIATFAAALLILTLPATLMMAKKDHGRSTTDR